MFSRLNTGEFLSAMFAWVDEFAGNLRGRGIAIDGKTLRGSFDRAAGKSPLHPVTAFATDTRLCLRQLAVDDKSNEIPAVRDLLKLMEIEGAAVTLDAMRCQVETARAIVAGGADYVLTVKGNQETLHKELNDEFIAYGEADYRVPGLRKQVTVERSHGRNERREYYFIEVPARLKNLKRWSGLRSIGMTYRRREIDPKVEEETTFVITSRPPKVREPSRFIRDHWGIENRRHWILDVTFAEYSGRIRKGSSPEVSGVFRRPALNILQRDTSIRENIRGKRLRAGWDEKVLKGICAASSSV